MNIHGRLSLGVFDRLSLFLGIVLLVPSVTLGAERLAYSREHYVILDQTRNRIILTFANKITCELFWAQGDGFRANLILRQINFAVEPSLPYLVFLNLPDNAEAIQTDFRFVGPLNFYGWGQNKSGRSVSYDVSHVLERLRKMSQNTCPISVTLFAPGSHLEKSKVTISRIELFETNN